MVDLFLGLYSFYVLIFSLFRGTIKEFFSLLSFLSLFFITFKIYPSFNLSFSEYLGTLFFVYLVFYFSAKYLDKKAREEEDFSKFKYAIGGFSLASIKLLIVMIFFAALYDMASLNLPLKKSKVIEGVKLATFFIDYDYLEGRLLKIAGNYVSSGLNSYAKGSSKNRGNENAGNKSASFENNRKKEKIKSLEELKKEMYSSQALQAITENEEIRELIKRGEYLKILNHPAVRKALSDPEIKNILNNVDYESIMKELKRNKNLKKVNLK